MARFPDWVLANVNATGYYRVHYDSGNWENLFLQLSTDMKVKNIYWLKYASCFIDLTAQGFSLI